MSTLTSFYKVGKNREKPRIWLESNRLADAGFAPGTPFTVVPFSQGLRIVLGGNRTVSSRKQGGALRPIIELCGSQVETSFRGIDIIRAKTKLGEIEIRPSIRAAAILRARNHTGPWRAFELFAGGGTLSDAIAHTPGIQLVGGAEIENSYADVWARKHPEAELFTGDIRHIHPAELPKIDILAAGIPCTSHSTMGRAKNKLAGRPEEGETGDLFAWVLNIIAYRCPAACVFENVPSFGESLAGSVLKTGLRHLGYHLEETILSPHHQWGEPSERKRWVLVATLSPGFSIRIPENPEKHLLASCLDAPDNLQDEQDALRIAKTIAGLRIHNARHAAKGNGFAFTTINRETQIVPTIPKSYHKINTGPFVETEFGPRLLRLHEAEAIMGARAGTSDYATGIQILGQGVQTRVWSQIFQQLGTFLQAPEAYGNRVAENEPEPIQWVSTSGTNHPEENNTPIAALPETLPTNGQDRQENHAGASKKPVQEQLDLF